jgi:glycosyltransferase involved in cell wall biosynthesis
MKVLGLISSPADPASQTRVIQYQNHLMKENVLLRPVYYEPSRDADPAPWMLRLKKITGINAWRISDSLKTLARLPLLLRQLNYDLIWQNRLMLPDHFYFEKKWKRPFVFDMDDAIWLTEGREKVQEVLRRSTAVFAGNEHLADFAKKFQSNVHIIPTTVDVDRLKPLQKKPGPFTLGWIGTKSNFQYLELIREPIIAFLSSHDARFMIVSSEKPSIFSFDDKKIIFKEWDHEKENELINEFDVGLMPLADDEWTRGKCSYKMLQYLACGKPAIVSPVGNNNKILSELGAGLGAVNNESWIRAFERLITDAAFYDTCSKVGRKLVEEKYAAKIWAGRIVAIFNTLC